MVIAVSVIALIVLALVIGEAKPKPTSLKSQASACGNYRSDRSIRINNQTIKAETPLNPAGFEKGLGGRPCILPNQGMLFSFRQPGQYRFWMKDMKFPIDVVWITSTHKVAAIEIDFQPSSYPEKRVNEIPAQYVLELKANRSKELHLSIGSSVQF